MEFCDFDDDVEDEDGNGDGTDGRPTVLGGAAYEPGRISLPATCVCRFAPFMAGELVFLVTTLFPATGIEEDNIFPDIWLDGLLDADDEVDDRGILETGEGAVDPDKFVKCLGLKQNMLINTCST